MVSRMLRILILSELTLHLGTLRSLLPLSFHLSSQRLTSLLMEINMVPMKLRRRKRRSSRLTVPKPLQLIQMQWSMRSKQRAMWPRSPMMAARILRARAVAVRARKGMTRKLKARSRRKTPWRSMVPERSLQLIHRTRSWLTRTKVSR